MYWYKNTKIQSFQCFIKSNKLGITPITACFTLVNPSKKNLDSFYITYNYALNIALGMSFDIKLPMAVPSVSLLQRSTTTLDSILENSVSNPGLNSAITFTT